MMPHDRPLRSESGSIAPLGIGLALISLSAILVFTSASSMFVLQRRLTTLAEFAALSEVRYGLSADDFLSRTDTRGMQGLRATKDAVTDGLTQEVTVCSIWKTPVPVIVALPAIEVCGYGAARAG
jgi:hypothetical protein